MKSKVHTFKKIVNKQQTSNLPKRRDYKNRYKYSIGNKYCISKIYIVASELGRLCSARLEASSGLMAEGVPTNNQRGRRSGPCRISGGLDKARHIVPTALLVRVQCLRKCTCVYKAVEGQSTRPIVITLINGSYCRRKRRLTIFERDEMKFGVSMAFYLTIYPIRQGLLLLWMFLFWGRCDFPISFSDKDMSRNVWNRL